MRIVSLCPSLTEAVCALGRARDLVGRTKFCVYPAEQLAEVPRVGGTKVPHLERIIAMAPDLVLMNEEENRREDAQALREAGLKVHASFPRKPAEVPALLRELGVALGAVAEAEALAVGVEAQLAAIRPAPTRRKFAYLVWRDPLMAAGRDTYVSNLLELAGGVNACPGGSERYPELDTAGLIAAGAEVVLLSSEPFPFATRHADALAEQTGLPRERFVLCDGQLLTWHGPRTGDAVMAAAALLAA
jgi:ABC-type hemin transport system substrate-binding protein